MKKNTKDLVELIILGAILFVLIVMLGVIGIQTKKENSTNQSNKNINESSNKKEETKEKEEVIENDKNSNEVINNKDDNKDNKDKIENNNSEIKDEVNSNTEVKSEENLVAFFTSFSNELDNNKREDDRTFREKVRSTFITIVDFLFYDGTIKGYKFSELTMSTKLKILKIVAGIDNKIDTYYPNYKDYIKEKCTDFKGKIALLYLKTTSKFCDKVGEDACREAREDFNNMKNSFGFTWEIIKEAAKNGKYSITEILSEWYKSIKEQ